ncbi:MAG: hypothetical protein WC975_06715 [Phycisphaerae bacterium]
MRITGGSVCCPDGVKRNCDVIVRDGRLFLEDASPRADGEIVNASGSFILPGFIEIHTHGAGLFEFTMGKYNLERGEFDRSEEIYAEELPRYAQRRASTGVTGVYLGTWASPLQQQQFCFRQLKKYMDSSGNGKDGSRILGGLLEGAFLNPQMAGAQNPAFIFKPEISLFDELNESGVIRLVNLVPDYEEASYRLTEYLTKKGISVGAGHTSATGEQFNRAIEKGLKYCIHFLNGPIGGSFKPFNGGGGVEAVLRENIYAEVIMDGIHVAPYYVRDVLARKGMDRVMAVSDAMFASQAQGVKEFTINGIKGRVDDGGRYVYVVDKPQLTLFSSIVTLDVAFGNLLSWLTADMQGAWHKRHEGMSFDEALIAAVKCCATNIADMLRWQGGDDLEAGELVNGKWADFVIADISGQQGNYKLIVKQVYVRGEKVWG